MFRVMSCNLRYGLAADGDNRWERRRHLVLARIRAFAPDLLGLQECRDDDQAACIRAGLADCQFLGVHRLGPGDTALEMAPLVFRSSRFDLLDAGWFWLSDTPDIPGSRSPGAAFPRTLTWVRLGCRQTGRELVFANTHLDYQPAAIDRNAQVLGHWLDQLGRETPLVLTGDFNADKRSAAYQLLTADDRLQDAYAAAHPADPAAPTFHGFGQATPPTAIDWILVSPHFRVQDAWIDRARQGELYPSDHYPLVAVLDWQG